MPLIHLHRVSRSYGHVLALNEVSMTLEPGTIGLVGNNGAGKSTLLKILLGLLPPDAGQGTILGYDVTRASSHIRGRVGYMAEAAATVPMLRGVEFVTLSGDLYGMPHRAAKRRAHEVLNYVGLGEMRYRRLDEYSTGNLQRLKLAAALVHDPDLLLLDEPTNGLDPPGRVAMLQLIEDLIAETGKSVILCTHLLGDVERLCQQVVVLDRGTVVLCGPMAQLRARRSDRYQLAWRGNHVDFAGELRRAGVEVLPSHNSHQATVHVTNGWTATRLFQLARQHDVVLTQMRPEQDDLQDLFFKVTESSHDPSDTAPPATQRGGA